MWVFFLKFWCKNMQPQNMLKFWVRWANESFKLIYWKSIWKNCSYESWLLYFGFTKQKQILILNIALLFFKIFSIKIDTLEHELELIIVALLPTSLSYLQKIRSQCTERFVSCRKTPSAIKPLKIRY